MTGEDQQPFHDGGPYYIEPSLCIYRAIQWIGFDFYKIQQGPERVNALLLVCTYQDIFLDYDKVIDNYTCKYPRTMLLINPLSEN